MNFNQYSCIYFSFQNQFKLWLNYIRIKNQFHYDCRAVIQFLLYTYRNVFNRIHCSNSIERLVHLSWLGIQPRKRLWWRLCMIDYLRCAACSRGRTRCRLALRPDSFARAWWSRSCSWHSWCPPASPHSAATVLEKKTNRYHTCNVSETESFQFRETTMNDSVLT